ncbi:MAG: FMN-binding protein [Eubacteriales bacterium]|nr:FMN-binding protein [Eubacteriales bacterium]
MDNKNMRGILGLVVVTLLAFGVILGTKAITGGRQGGSSSGEGQKAEGEEMDVSGAEGIEKAIRLKKGGYETVVKTKGYGGDITMSVNFQKDKKTLDSVAVLEQAETEGLGARITETEFLSQFEGMKAPVSLGGGSGTAGKEKESGDESGTSFAGNSGGPDELEGAELSDGTYEAKGEPDDSGFTDIVSLTVRDGKIAQVSWDSVDDKGQSKALLSESGEYVMTEEGLTWKEQAEALGQALTESQSLKIFDMDEQGKTDAVSGVSISIGGFLNLAEQCLRDAAGLPADGESTAAGSIIKGTSEVDGISGATVSSSAVARGINLAYEFLQEAGK